MSITTTRLTVLLALLIGTMPIANAADDEILKRLDAIEVRLNKIEKGLAETKTAKEVNPADVFKEISKALAQGREERNKQFEDRNKQFEAEKLTRQREKEEQQNREKQENQRKLNEKLQKRAKAKQYFEITKWDTKEHLYKNISGMMPVFYTVKNLSSKKISIVDGWVFFEDKMGKYITEFKIAEDLNLAPNDEQIFKATSFKVGLHGDPERLRVIDKKFVNIHFDINRILFEDGSVVEF